MAPFSERIWQPHSSSAGDEGQDAANSHFHLHTYAAHTCKEQSGGAKADEAWLLFTANRWSRTATSAKEAAGPTDVSLLTSDFLALSRMQWFDFLGRELARRGRTPHLHWSRLPPRPQRGSPQNLHCVQAVRQEGEQKPNSSDFVILLLTVHKWRPMKNYTGCFTNVPIVGFSGSISLYLNTTHLFSHQPVIYNEAFTANWCLNIWKF